MRKRRAKRIFVRVSAAEYELLTAKSKAAGTTLSTLVRDHIQRVRIYNHAEDEQWLRSISAMTNSVAALSRMAANLRALDAVVTTAYLAAIHRQLEELNRKQTTHACEVFPSRNRNE